MLAKSKYDNEYIASCRRNAEEQLDLWTKLVKKSPGPEADDLEPRFMSDLVLVMDSFFAHRTRGAEDKDGNPINEVTMIRDSLHEHGGVFTGKKTIRYNVEDSVLGQSEGDRINLTAADLAKLVPAHFDEMLARFT
ncbi:MAG: hypothetical protein QG596_436 [Actinomycetota bacterium]|nr:hypothetical protein [Actinomycetota bacterium]